MELLHDAVQNLDISAEMELGLLHGSNMLLPRSQRLSNHWLLKAAKRGRVEAQWRLAIAYYAEREHYAEAAFWFREAAMQGNTYSQNRLAWMYDNGEGVEQDDAQTTYWYRQAALKGDAAGENNYAWMLDLGQCVEQSDTEALAWYHKSAAQGFMNAQFSLGSMYELGQGVERDDEKALDWYAKADEQIEQDAVVHYRTMSSEARRALSTDSELVDWYRQQAETESSSAAQYNLGLLYEKGLLGISKDIYQAMDWYRKASKQHHENARQRLNFYSRKYPSPPGSSLSSSSAAEATSQTLPKEQPA
ncbi:hypothetical protein DFQ27_006462 [Actinomortierella ambigua]|uniref:Sel1 repeat family protein n=1 Tax=Actinomortierella ambigua TaxID=1343610 RepID=A0A9P6UB00_9FUNG|nr:hypothetical protein DFQ27_006462 [Actinomortierella ambigua]